MINRLFSTTLVYTLRSLTMYHIIITYWVTILPKGWNHNYDHLISNMVNPLFDFTECDTIQLYNIRRPLSNSNSISVSLMCTYTVVE